tara:strand:+ start:1219 stop:2100 length:882 start_codon:yes stop_codon:yes gene_type:complete
MPKTLIANTIKNVYQKIIFFLTTDNKLYKTTEDGENDDTVITTIANDLTLSGSNTFSGTSTFNGSIAGTSVKDEDNMASNSATSVATQQSIKVYADTKHALTTVGIADNNLVEMDDADAADDDYAKFTANGLEGRNYAEVKTDLSLNNLTNDAQLPLSGGIMTGQITLGGNPVNDLHVSPKQYVHATVDARTPAPTTVTVSGSNNGVTFTGENGKWALISACTADIADTLLVFIFFSSSGASVYKILGGSALTFNSKTGLTISFIGLSSGQKLHIQRIGGNSAVSAAQATLSP